MSEAIDGYLDKSKIDGLIKSGEGLEAYEMLNKLSSGDLQSVRNICGSTIRKLKNIKNLKVEDMDETSSMILIQLKKSYLVKCMIDSRLSDNGMSTSRLPATIQSAIDQI